MRALSWLLALLIAAAPLVAQSNGSSEAERRLDLRRAKINERQAAAALEQQRRLFAQGLSSKAELDRAEAESERTRLDTERSQVELANELPSFQVLSAVKSVSAAGDITVTLQLRELERGYEEGLQRGYLVSLQAGQTVVSEPYQRQVTLDGRGHRTISLPFRMLRDADEVTVLVMSGTRREQFPILLQHDASDRRIQVACANPSQEGALGGKVEYALHLERGSAAQESVRFAVRDLPSAFVTEWMDADSNAKLSLLQFGENQHSLKVILRVFLPVTAESSWFDQTLQFRIDAMPSSGSASLGGIGLQLRPVGAPRVTLSTDNLLTTLAPGERKVLDITLENLGGAAAHDVLFETNPPVGITAQVEPPTINELAPREKRVIHLTISSGVDAIPAEYNLKLQARAQNRLATVDSPELSLRVAIRGSVMSMATVSVTGLLLFATMAAVVLGVRAIRR